MIVHTLPLGPFESNCYIVHAKDDPRALVIDPGDGAQEVLDFIDLQKLRVVAYPITHGHMDHVYGLAKVHARHPAPIGMHPRDAKWAFSTFNIIMPFNEPPESPGPIERAYEDGQVWEDAGLAYRIIDSPGHSPGGVCFYFEKEGVVFSGDTLFQGSIGRLDLPGSKPKLMANSLLRLLELPDVTVVYPGHGPATTIGDERATNPFLQELL